MPVLVRDQSVSHGTPRVEVDESVVDELTARPRGIVDGVLRPRRLHRGLVADGVLRSATLADVTVLLDQLRVAATD